MPQATVGHVVIVVAGIARDHSARDFDGDGRAEMMSRTANGTVDGTGVVIGDAAADYRDSDGYVLSGPEFLTLFDGMSGAALDTIDYIPPRGNIRDWGDSYGNRVDRFQAGVAYLDGVHPSVVMTRGIYTRIVLAAFDWKDTKLAQRWVFDSDVPGMGKDGKFNIAYAGQGNHSLTVADVNHDGKDEIVYGACCIDNDVKGLYTTGWGHGDAEHVSAFDPDSTDLQIFDIHEVPTHPWSAELHDAATGKLIWGYPGKMNEPEKWGGQPDVGRAMAAEQSVRPSGAAP